jgi:hypothetical protein
MASSFETTGDEHPIGAVLERFHKVFRFQSSGAGCANNPNVRRVLNPHRTRKVGG